MGSWLCNSFSCIVTVFFVMLRSRSKRTEICRYLIKGCGIKIQNDLKILSIIKDTETINRHKRILHIDRLDRNRIGRD